MTKKQAWELLILLALMAAVVTMLFLQL